MANRLYIGTQQGVITLTKRQEQWTLDNQALEGWDVEEVAVDQAQPNRVLAGTRGDGVWVSEDGGSNWKKPSYGKPGPGKVRCLTLDPRDTRHVYVGTEPIQLFVSEDGGANWEHLDTLRALPWIASITYPVPSVEPHIRDVVINPKDSGTIYVALQVGFMVTSTDGGATWKRLEQGVDPDIHTIVVNPDRPENMIVATGGGASRSGNASGRALYLSQNGGDSWIPVGMEFTQDYAVPLVPRPGNPAVLYCALADGPPARWHRPDGAKAVFIRSMDGGRSWHRLDRGLDKVGYNFPMSIAVDPQDPDQIFLGLDGSLGVSEDGGESWRVFDTHLPYINDIKGVTV